MNIRNAVVVMVSMFVSMAYAMQDERAPVVKKFTRKGFYHINKIATAHAPFVIPDEKHAVEKIVAMKHGALVKKRRLAHFKGKRTTTVYILGRKIYRKFGGNVYRFDDSGCNDEEEYGLDSPVDNDAQSDQLGLREQEDAQRTESFADLVMQPISDAEFEKYCAEITGLVAPVLSASE